MEIFLDTAYNCDCKELLTEMQDCGLKADWCITDPPYGLNIASKGRMGGNGYAKARDYHGLAEWDNERIPSLYFDMILDQTLVLILFLLYVL